MSWRFGDCELDCATRELRRAGRSVPLTPKTLRLLELLLQKHPAAVSRQEIHDALWPDTSVSESTLATLVWELRTAIADEPRGSLLRTVHGFGYAFSGHAERVGESGRLAVEGPAVRPGAPAPRARSDGVHRWPDGLPVGRRPGLLGVLALSAIVVVAGAWLARDREPAGSPARVRPLTNAPGEAGIEWHPALSPDGRLVAFLRNSESGGVDLCVKQIDGDGEPLVISSGSQGAFTPTWSPDGHHVAYIRHLEGDDGSSDDGVFVVPALGGTPRHLATLRGPHGLSWSPDGRHLAAAHQGSLDVPASIRLLSVDSGEHRRLTKPPASFDGDSHPSFSPDGRSVAFVRKEAPWETDVYVVAVEGGDERRLTVGNSATEGLSWSEDGRTLVFSSWRRGGTGEFCLWRVPVSGGEPEPLWFGENGKRPTISRTGRRLAYMKQMSSWNIWRAGGPAAAADERTPRPIIVSSFADIHPSYSPDGSRIAFTSGRSGALEIWVCESDGSNPRQLSFLDALMTGNPAWSPDGQTIAFFSDRDGNWDVWTVAARGGVPRRLTTGPDRDLMASWSRDGHWVYFFSKRTGRLETWRVPARGGEAVQVTTRGGTHAVESVDGRFLYYNKSDLGGAQGTWRMPRDGGPELQVLEWGLPLSWTVVEAGLLHLDHSRGFTYLELLDVEAGEVTPVVELRNVSGPGLSMSPDGRWVVYVGGDTFEADIMLVEGFE